MEVWLERQFWEAIKFNQDENLEKTVFQIGTKRVSWVSKASKGVRVTIISYVDIKSYYKARLGVSNGKMWDLRPPPNWIKIFYMKVFFEKFISFGKKANKTDEFSSASLTGEGFKTLSFCSLKQSWAWLSHKSHLKLNEANLRRTIFVQKEITHGKSTVIRLVIVQSVKRGSIIGHSCETWTKMLASKWHLAPINSIQRLAVLS